MLGLPAEHEPVIDSQGEKVEDRGGQREDQQEALDHVAHLHSPCSWSFGSTNLGGERISKKNSVNDTTYPFRGRAHIT